MNSRHLFLALGALLLCAPASALAQEDESTEADPEPEVSSQSDQWDRVLSIGVSGAWDGPLGLGSGQLEIAPFRYLGIYVGAGASRSGVRVGGGVNLRFPVGDGAVGLFTGLTGGPEDWDSRGAEEVRIHRYWEFGLHLHGGATFEYRWPMGLYGRFSVGADGLMTPQEPTECELADGTACGEVQENLYKPVRGFAMLTIGYAFDL